jgi:hypothetical protein
MSDPKMSSISTLEDELRIICSELEGEGNEKGAIDLLMKLASIEPNQLAGTPSQRREMIIKEISRLSEKYPKWKEIFTHASNLLRKK